MMFAAVLFLLLFTDADSRSGGSSSRPVDKSPKKPTRHHVEDDWESSNDSCSLHQFFHSNFKDYVKTAMTRPVINANTSLEVKLDVLVYGILDMNEKEQKFTSYIWVDMIWYDEYVKWEPEENCGVVNISIPTEVLWKPDLAISEMTEKDKASPSPYLTVRNDGRVLLRNDMVVISICMMEIYRFPFDHQSCKLTFKSVSHSKDQIYFTALTNESENTKWSHELMRTKSEWVFIDLTTATTEKNNFGIYQSMLIVSEGRPLASQAALLGRENYTGLLTSMRINMRRRSILYIANFMLPIFLFMCLDMASFLISDTGGEKLGFQVTVLLAVTVMQLILNEILPSSSNAIPLIAVYCLGIFGLMMLSLLETILVMYLFDKDTKEREKEKDQSVSKKPVDKKHEDGSPSCFKRLKNCVYCVFDVVPETQLLPETNEGSSSQLTEEANNFEKISDDLRDLTKTLTEFLDNTKEERSPTYWIRLIKIINRVYFIFYVTAATVFLSYMAILWNLVEAKQLIPTIHSF